MHVVYKIVVDGEDVTSNFADRLVSITVIDEAGQKSDTAEIMVDDRDYLVALPETGAKLEISLGVGELVEMGTYVVDDSSGEIAPDTMSVGAKAADMLGGIRARKTRSWRDVTVEDIVGKIAGEHGLKPLVSDSLKAHFYAYQAQTSESDLNFLTRLAKGLDAVSKPAGEYLVFTKRGEGKAADGSELPVFVVHRTQMKGGSWKITGRGKYGRVTAEWGERGTATTHKVTAGDKEPELALRHRYPTEAEAQSAADAALERSRRASGKISIELGGFWAAVDAGLIVSPDNALNQIEGGIVFGVSSALYERIDIEQGEVVQSNFWDYEVARARNTPEMSVYLAEVDAPPTGVGEAGSPMVSGAIANAFFAATGKRLRHMPFTPDRVLAALES